MIHIHNNSMNTSTYRHTYEFNEAMLTNGFKSKSGYWFHELKLRLFSILEWTSKLLSQVLVLMHSVVLIAVFLFGVSTFLPHPFSIPGMLIMGYNLFSIYASVKYPSSSYHSNHANFLFRSEKEEFERNSSEYTSSIFILANPLLFISRKLILPRLNGISGIDGFIHAKRPYQLWHSEHEDLIRVFNEMVFYTDDPNEKNEENMAVRRIYHLLDADEHDNIFISGRIFPIHKDKKYRELLCRDVALDMKSYYNLRKTLNVLSEKNKKHAQLDKHDKWKKENEKMLEEARAFMQNHTEPERLKSRTIGGYHIKDSELKEPSSKE